jgi:hypothetical protein
MNTQTDTPDTMKAFHGKQEIKDEYVARVKAHAEADEIIKGKYWENGKGCAVGCTIHGSNHSLYETELGIPRIIARLEDGIFEALPNDLAMTWPIRFLEAITPGSDLSMVWPRFAIWLLADPKDGVIRFATDKTKLKIEKVAHLYLQWIRGDKPKKSEWRAYADAAAYAADAAAYAADAAADAAAYAADAAAYAAYAYAYAADAAAYAAAAAAYAADAYAAYAAAAAAYAADAACRASRVRQSEKLLALLQEAV